jgi:hypothetical protein
MHSFTHHLQLRNPEMQKMLYPYLPEPMRNPESIEWMLNNPEVKKQMTQLFEQQVRPVCSLSVSPTGRPGICLVSWKMKHLGYGGWGSKKEELFHLS